MASINASRETASLGDFMQLLRLRKALIALILALVVLTTLGATAFMPKWYLATTKVLVEKPEGTKVFQAQAANSYDPYFLQDQFKVMQSEKILYPVIRNLDLGAKLGAMLGSPAPLTPDVAYRYLLDRMLRVESQRNSSLIEINVHAQEPALAAAIANEIARVYSEDRLALATTEQREGLLEARKRVAEQEEAVRAQANAVERLRSDLRIAGFDIGARNPDMEVDTLRQMQTTLNQLRVEASGRKTRFDTFRSIRPEDRISVVNAETIQDPNIQLLLQGYLQADLTVARLKSANLGEAHPDYRAAVENRTKSREQLDRFLSGYEQSLEMSYREADARVAELELQIQKAKGEQILSASERMRPFNDAVLKLEDENKSLTQIRNAVRLREIETQQPKRTIEILNIAEPPRGPSKPNWTLNFIFSLFFGLILGVGVAVLVEYFDLSFRSVADVEERVKLPVLGVIPHKGGKAGRLGDDPAESEPYRVLHTNINMALPLGKPSALVIFSAGPGEGKSTTLYHLAHIIASTGEKVLLIDSDVRRPTQHNLAERPRGPGLSELLSGKARLEDVVSRDVAPGLDFIPSGTVPGFTLSLHYQDELRRLVSELKGRYQKVVFDSPPIIGVSDASVLASAMDGAILLIQHRRNPASMVLRAKQVLEGLKTPIVGVVLNQVPLSAGDDYSYYTSNYSYYSEGGAKRRPSGPAKPGRKPAAEDRLEFRE